MNKRKGQAIVEIAIALPILAFLLCGIIDFGRILYAGVTLNMVSQEAARYAGLGKSDDYVIQYVHEKSPLSGSNTIDVTFDPPKTDVPRKSGSYVTVYLKYNVDYITPLMKVIIPSPYALNTKSTIRVE